jgi:hypothetical protein
VCELNGFIHRYAQYDTPPPPFPPNKHNHKPQALKKKKNALYEAVKGKEAALAEVGAAVRKLQLAQRCGVGVDEVVTITVEVPEAAVARVIGKGGANLRKIEEVRSGMIGVVSWDGLGGEVLG